MSEVGPLILLLATSLRMATPLLFTALGELYTEKSGVMNLGVEGLMIAGAFFGFVITYFSQDPWLGVLAGLISGALLSLIFAFCAISLGVNQVVTGIALNLFILGSSNYIFRLIYGIPKVLPFTNFAFKEINIPGLSQIPFIGPIFFSQRFLTYIALFLCLVLYIILYRTRFGLKIIACGESPEAADTRGINVHLIRYICVIIGGGLAGMGGAFLSIAQFNQFTPGMVAGRGYIAFALVIFGRWSPGRIIFGALLFGFIEALALLFQSLITFPHQIIMMLPYIITIVALIAVRKHRSAQPSFLAIPYSRNR